MSQVQDIPYEKERSIYLSDYYHRVHISLSKKERAISQMTYHRVHISLPLSLYVISFASGS